MTIVRGLVLPYDERRVGYLRPIETDELQAVVGGYIEMVRLSSTSHMYVNEEGKLQGLPFNISANRLLRFAPLTEDFHLHDMVVGTVVILGTHKSPEEGDVRAEVMSWCDMAGIEVRQAVAGMPVTRATGRHRRG